METVEFDTKIVGGYMELLRNLSPDGKLDLISKLSESLKSTLKDTEPTLKELYGSFKSEQSAEELIDDIRQARSFNRKIEDL